MKTMQPDVIDLEDAIDIHFHPHPDLIPRATDDRGVVRLRQTDEDVGPVTESEVVQGVA